MDPNKTDTNFIASLSSRIDFLLSENGKIKSQNGKIKSENGRIKFENKIMRNALKNIWAIQQTLQSSLSVIFPGDLQTKEGVSQEYVEPKLESLQTNIKVEAPWPVENEIMYLKSQEICDFITEKPAKDIMKYSPKGESIRNSYLEKDSKAESTTFKQEPAELYSEDSSKSLQISKVKEEISLSKNPSSDMENSCSIEKAAKSGRGKQYSENLTTENKSIIFMFGHSSFFPGTILFSLLKFGCPPG